MKRYNSILYMCAATLFAALTCASCGDLLDLGPIDYYGSESYWKTEANFDSYIDGLHKNMRDQSWTHTIVIGEMRGGAYRTGTGSDGSSLDYQEIIDQNFDNDHTGLSSFGNYYGRITNVNLFIARLEASDVVSAAKKETYLGIAYGLRAFYYFDLYRTYGNVPLRLDVAVIDGELDPVNLYMGRNPASEVLAQIKSDLKSSLDHFGATNNFPYGKSYWSKAATEALAAEVYLWSAKVSVLDQKAGGASDIAQAKTYLKNLESNYGLALQNDFSSIFSTKKNGEVIFSIHFGEGEATNALSNYTYMSDGRGETMNRQLKEDGTIFGDELKLNTAGIQRCQYLDNMFLSYDREDSRRDATFIASYDKTVFENTGVMQIFGTNVRKNIGYQNAAGVHQFEGDFIYYRLAWVYLSLAEVANYEGNGTDVAKYINLVRKRAYGANWTPDYEYTAGSFTQNELAILAEKDKELIQEGQRWFDVCRMTLTKDGKHLVFCPEGNPANDGTSVLKESEAYKVLWPLDKTILGNDPELTQTQGY